MPRTQIALAGRVKPGDTIIIDGASLRVARVKRAHGRQPSEGENLHVIVDDGVILRRNSLSPVRIASRRSS